MFSFIRAVMVMVSLHSNRKSKTELVPEWDIVVIGVTMLLFGGMHADSGTLNEKSS